MTYMIATGHNNTAGYGTIDPQPKARGMVWGRRLLGGDGIEQEDGYRSQSWSFGYMTQTQMAAFLIQAGLGEGTPSAAVTVSTTRSTDHAFDDYNATILFPEMPDAGGFYDRLVFQELEFRLVRLSEI